MGELRESKKRETRQRLSNVATELFFDRGFEAVTVDEIAAAANVSKVTVFNYFARKEDLFIDREDDLRQILHDAFSEKPKSSIDATRALVRRLIDEKHPLVTIDKQTVQWWRVVAHSPSLKARLRELGDETIESLAGQLGGGKPDGATRLFAGLVVTAWRTAYAEGLRVAESGGSLKKANLMFSELIERGFAAAARAS